MDKEALQTISEFMKPEASGNLKYVSLDCLLNFSSTKHGMELMLKNETIVQNVIELTHDREEEICKRALYLLVNISASTEGSIELLKYKPKNKQNIVELCISYILDKKKKYADAACMMLSNITRIEDSTAICVDTFLPHLHDILNALVNLKYNEKGSNLHFLGAVVNNLSTSARIRKWLTEGNPVPVVKLLPFFDYKESVVRRGGAMGTIKNLSFNTEYHELLLSKNLDLLTYLLSPLMGNEEYPDEEMDKLPIALQYLPKDKKRDEDTDLRKMLLETLNKLCATRKGREILRDNGVYYVLREYHKWEKDPETRLTCENVVDILIQKEEEVGADDLSKVEIPEDMVQKFQKMNQQYIKDMK